MISHVDIMGALIYRTREALNKRPQGQPYSKFYSDMVDKYPYYRVCFDNTNPNSSEGIDTMHLWHFPETPDAIKEAFDIMGKKSGGDNMQIKYPCVFNFQSIVETYGVQSDGLVQIQYELAIVTPVLSNWTSEQRDRMAHRYVLEPIHDELIKQIKKCGWFQIPLTGVNYKRMKVFTTGQSIRQATQVQFGDYVDYIQLSELRLNLKQIFCEAEIEQIQREAELVTDSILFK